MSLAREQLLERYGRVYGELGLAIAFTETVDPARGDPKKCTTRGWDKTKPLADGNFGAAMVTGRGQVRNPVVVLRASGLIGIECDTPERLAQLEALGLPTTVTVQSSEAYKRHYWYRPWSGDAPEIVAFRFEKTKIIADAGRYLLVPPALHPSGAVYSFLPGLGPDEVEIAVLLEANYAKLVRLSETTGKQERERLARDPGAAIPEGARNDTLASFAGAMRRRGMSEDEILAALNVANAKRCRPLLTDDEVEQIAANIAGYEPAKPAPALVSDTDDSLVETLDSIVAFIRRFVCLTDVQADALALWVAHTHAIGAAACTPYIGITSPEKRSGKTRLLEVLELLVRTPLPTANISDAALFRAIGELTPTLLFDEIDAIFGPKARDREDLRGMLNAGYREGAVARRMGGPRMTNLEAFPVYCAKAFAGIGELPDTLSDRAIRIRLERRTRDEPLERFRRRDAKGDAEPIRTNIESQMSYLLEALTSDRPHLPDELDDRQQDCWEPLFAIADRAGGHWHQRARVAAVTLSDPDAREDESLSAKLLGDIHAVFDETGSERYRTADLIGELSKIEESPWGDWHGKSITPQGLSKLLKPYRIRTQSVWVDGATARGYKREQFADAWRRMDGVRTGRSGRSGSLSQIGLTPPTTPTTVEDQGVRPNASNHAGSTTPTSSHASRPLIGDPGYALFVHQAHTNGHLTEPELYEQLAVSGDVFDAVCADSADRLPVELLLDTEPDLAGVEL